MNLNVQFLDSIVRRYFSLQHTMSVEVAVCVVLSESLNALKSLLQTENPCEKAEIPILPDMDMLFISSDFRKTLQEFHLDDRFAVICKDLDILPDIAEWSIKQGLMALLDKLDKPYLLATARGFGISKSSSSKLRQTDLIVFIARVALDVEFHTDPPAPQISSNEFTTKSPNRIVSSRKSSTPNKSPKPLHNTFVETQISETSSIASKKNRKEGGGKRKGIRVNLFTDEQLPRKSKKRRLLQSTLINKNSKENVRQSPSKKPLVPQAPSEIDISILEMACCGPREVPLDWLRKTEPKMAWMMLFNTSNVKTEDLQSNRIPIGAKTSIWQLQQWFFAGELQKYCSDNKLFIKGKKKSAVISGIMKHLRTESQSADRKAELHQDENALLPTAENYFNLEKSIEPFSPNE